MKKRLRVLSIEDSERDAALLRRHLLRAGYDLVFERIDTAEEMTSALESQSWDVILSDYSMPRFSARQALALLKQTGQDIPLIVVSGTIGEETAVKTMRAGAHDYLMKDQLARLAPAIERELHEAEHRQARRRAEAALLQSEDRYRDLVEHSRELICTHDLEGRILSFNKAVVSGLGYDRDTLLQRNISDLLFPEFRDEFDKYIAELQEHGIACGMMAVRTSAGEQRIWEYTNTLRTEGVSLPVVRGMARDVTEQRRAEEALKASERELRALFEGMTDVILVIDTEGRHLKMAPTRPAKVYKSPEERIGKTLHEIFAKDKADVFLEHIRRALTEERMCRIEYCLPIKGEPAWFEGSISPMSKDSVIWIARDITDRKQAEQEQARLNAELENQRARLKNIVDSVPGVVWEAWGEPDGATQRINFVSDYVETMLGYNRDEWLSTPNFWLSIVHPDDREQAAIGAAADFSSGRSANTREFRWVAKDGRVLWVESNSAVINDDNGRPIGLRGVTTDISERKRVEEALRNSEEQLQQSQKLEAVGQLAGGIAHDFNNLLTVISGYCGFALKQLKQDQGVRHCIQEINRAGERAAALTRQLLAFSRRQVLQTRIIDLNSVVSEMGRMLQRLIGENIELRTVLDFKLGCVKADPGQIEQVIMNLAVNARDAMPEGGKLTIETASVFLDDQDTARQPLMSPGHYVLLAVNDNGTGIEKHVQAHIFEPFFTTKGVGKGTGLGLSTVYGIVKQSGGNILVESEIGQGTTFKVYLPRVDEEVREKEGRSERLQDVHGSETILLVEDDDMVRQVVVEVLRTNGYRILEAANGNSALRLAESHQDPIHLLLTDVVMPEISGRELADQVTHRRPGIEVLYISGYTDDSVVRDRILDSTTGYLQKPFTTDALLQKVREVIDRSNGHRESGEGNADYPNRG